MNQCHTCEHWKHVYDNAFEQVGTCGNEDVQGRVNIVNEAVNMDEDAQIYTAATFGCIYWENGEKGVVKL